MKTEDREQMGEIYEALDFQSSYKGVDPQVEQAKAKANQICQALEHKLEGVISAYKYHKTEFFNNPRDMNHLEALEGMFNILKEPLYPWQEFRYEDEEY